MHRAHAFLFAATLLAISAPSQVDPRRFAPRDYTVELRADMAALVDSGFWDLVERSPMRMLLTGFRTGFGFDLADLDEARMVQRADPPPEGAEPWQFRREQVWILKGSERVGTARFSEAMRGEYPIAEKVAGVEVLRSAFHGRELTSPAPGVLVVSYTVDNTRELEGGDPPPGLVADTLAGRRKGGTPVPDLMALTASPRALVVVAAVASGGVDLEPDNMQPFPAEWFVEGDLPRGFRLQLVKSEDGERMALEVLVRFAGRGGPGARTMADGFAATRAQLAEDAQLRMVAAALEPVETTIDRGDLTFTLDLGDERQMGQRLSPLLLAMGAALVVVDSSAEPKAVGEPLVFEVEAAEEPPAPKPVDPGPKKKD